jgi:DNA-binding SARP family transcriptional activator
MRFALLGPLVIVGDSGQQAALAAPRLRVLLAALLLHADTPVSRSALAEAVWDGQLPPAALETLRSYVRRLRRALGPQAGALIEARDPGYLIRIGDAELDVLEFEALCRDAAAALRAAAWSQASDAAGRAAGLWRGAPLLDVPSRLLRDEIAPRLEQLLVQALEDRAEADLHLGRHEHLVPQLRDLTVQHPLRERFHAQLMLTLYRCGRQAEALEAFLRALGVPPQEIPSDVEQRAALYRQHLADTRTLVLLDNAAGEAQVRPLLPGGVGCLVLITSRRHLKGLDDAHVVPLDVLSRADSVTLLRAVTGPERLRAGDPVLGEIADLCGHLPLALRIAAALLRHRPTWAPGHLTDLLRDQQRRVAALDDGERDLGAVFDLSYHILGEQHQRVFRQLGLIPGPIPDAYAVAATAGTTPDTAARLLEDLVDHNLLASPVPGRYRLHDLIRLHALALAEHDPAEDRQAALGRLLDYYQLTAGRADALITHHPRPGAAGGPRTGHAPALADSEAALTWLRMERPNLLDALRSASGRHTVALTAGLAALLRTDGPWSQAVALHAEAVSAARQLGDHRGQAGALTELGQVRMLSGDYPGATRDLTEALRRYRELGDRRGQGNALTRLGHVLGSSRDYPRATGDLTEALRLHRELGDWRGQADALTELGQVRMLTGDCAGAERDLTEALRLFQELGELNGQPIALTWLGQVRRATGDYPGATRDLTEALGLFQDLGNRRGQAAALTELGDVRRAIGDYAGAARDLLQALRLCQDLGERNGQAVALTWLGAVRRSSGDLPGATRDLQTALELFRRIGARNNEAVAINHYAAAVAAGCDQPRALSLYRQALDLAREISKLDEQARALEGIGECHLGLGDAEAGVAPLRQAKELFRRLAMTPDAERVQARLAQTEPTESPGLPR